MFTFLEFGFHVFKMREEDKISLQAHANLNMKGLQSGKNTCKSIILIKLTSKATVDSSKFPLIYTLPANELARFTCL
jgi:hypothetical protein